MKRLLFLLTILFLIFGCSVQEKQNTDLPFSFQVKLMNPADFSRSDEFITIRVDDLKNFNPDNFVVFEGDSELASQAIDEDGDGIFEKIGFLDNFAPNEIKNIKTFCSEQGKSIKTYRRRAYAELSQKVGGHFENKKYIGGRFQNVAFSRVPAEHAVHSGYYRYEGPGWESDKIGFRFYLDWRNAIDIFGKKTHDIVLPKVGFEKSGSYHEMSDWGMDIFKVGNSLGIGSVGIFHKNRVGMVAETDSVTCQILGDGPLWAGILTKYFGWKADNKKIDLKSKLTITGGTRMTRHDLEVSGEVENLCTGFVKHEQCQLLKPQNEDGSWQYLGYWGKQSLAGDNLGIAVLYRKQDLIQLTEDDVNHIIVLKPNSSKVSYYFLAAWEQEIDGIKTMDKFQGYLERTKSELNNPIVAK